MARGRLEGMPCRDGAEAVRSRLDTTGSARTYRRGWIIGLLQIALRPLVCAQWGRRGIADRLERTMRGEHRVRGRRRLDGADREVLAAVAARREQRAFERSVAQLGALVKFPSFVPGVDFQRRAEMQLARRRPIAHGVRQSGGTALSAAERVATVRVEQ